MPCEVVGTKRKRKHYEMPFIRRIDKKPVARFTNYNKYDRREALKKFLDASHLRHLLDVEEDMEQLENDPTTSRFLVANQSSYGRAMDQIMKTFVTREQELSNVDIRGQNNPKPKVILENPNSTALLFQDHYKFGRRNPRACKLSTYISGKFGSLLKSEQFREKVERGKGNILSGLKKTVITVKMMMMMMMMMNLMIMMTVSIETARVKSSQASKHVQTVRSITY